MPKIYSLEDINNIKPKTSRLTAISFSDKKGTNRGRYINCICKCGKIKTILVSEITTGGTTSCGCAHTDMLIKRNTKYVGNKHEINQCYHDMIRRCYDKECANYRFYGAKGVIVCDEWKNDYQKFLNWAKANGWAPGLHLDKDIKSKGKTKIYSPENCSFVTRRQNLLATGIRSRNKKGRFSDDNNTTCLLTTEKVIKIFNSIENSIELSEKFGVSRSTIYGIKNGRDWSHVTGKMHLPRQAKVKYQLKGIRKGESCHSAKLKENQVIEIYNSKISNIILAEKYGVSPSAIHKIKTGKKWKHITGQIVNQTTNGASQRS